MTKRDSHIAERAKLSINETRSDKPASDTRGAVMDRRELVRRWSLGMLSSALVHISGRQPWIAGTNNRYGYLRGRRPSDLPHSECRVSVAERYLN